MRKENPSNLVPKPLLGNEKTHPQSLSYEKRDDGGFLFGVQASVLMQIKYYLLNGR